MNEEVFEKIYNAHKNLIVEGDIGSGKTSNILFPLVNKAIDNRESLFILDSKEEYLNKYYDRLKIKDYNIVIINMKDLDKSEGWNPLEYPFDLYKKGEHDRAQEYVETMSKTMFYDHAGLDPFWSSTASDFFTGLTLALFEDGKENEINLNSISSMFSGVDKKIGKSDYITEYFKTKDVNSKPYLFASPTFLAPSETKGGILAVARQKLLMFVTREKLNCLMNKTTFKIEDFVNKPTAIIFIARDDTKYLNILTTIFIEQLYSILVDFRINNKFNFILDNFDVIGKCNGLVDILESCLSRKIKLFLGIHSMDKIVDCYGKYISNLCDLVSINNNNVKMLLNNEEESVIKNFETVSIESADISYPSLMETKIELFDIEKYVESKRKNVNFTFEPLDNLASLNKIISKEKMDKMQTKVDNKVEELELEKAIEDFRENKGNIKSELEQFKRDNGN